MIGKQGRVGVQVEMPASTKHGSELTQDPQGVEKVFERRLTNHAAKLHRRQGFGDRFIEVPDDVRMRLHRTQVEVIVRGDDLRFRVKLLEAGPHLAGFRDQQTRRAKAVRHPPLP